jgi:predicted RNA-binding Zn-ribbon protein involved in translation (DUF1610 family)
MSYALVRLSCPACGAAMRGEPFDVLFVCPSCGSGAVVEGKSLSRIPSAALAPARGRKAEVWKPGWLIEAKVGIAARETARGGGIFSAGGRDPSFLRQAVLDEIARKIGGGRGILGEILGGIAAGSQVEGAPVRIAAGAAGGARPQASGDARARAESDARRFVVPAFELPLHALISLSIGYALAAIQIVDAPRETVTGGVLTLDDALALVLHRVIGAEVGKPDMLASLDVTLTPVAHSLIALPFERRGPALRCAVTGEDVGTSVV